MSEVLISIVNYRSYDKTVNAVESIYEKASGKYTKNPGEFFLGIIRIF